MTLISAGLIVAGVLLGFCLQTILPRSHLTDESKETLRIAGGLLATLTALVLGLLVTAANGSFDATNTAIVQGGAKMIMLDRVLANYGPESSAARAQLRQSLSDGIRRIWLPDKRQVGGSQALESGIEMLAVQKKLHELKPQNNAQQALIEQASQITRELAQSRWVIIEQMQNHLPIPLLIVLVFWSTALFVSFGLLAPRNVTVLVVLLVCALSVSMAIGLVLELNRPLDGIIRVSDAPLRKVLEFIGN